MTKRLFDIIFSIFILLLTFPLMLAIALAIKLVSRGQILYKAPRIGLLGKPFTCYKFQTMYPNAYSSLKELLETRQDLQKEWGLYRKLKHDPRITPLGKFLRKTSLDELPQFWNVLKGDLSVVGPRPLSQEEIEMHYGAKVEKMLSIRPGITGLSQTSGRSHLTLRERIELEVEQIDSYSLSRSCVLIAKTIIHVLLCKGAY